MSRATVRRRKEIGYGVLAGLCLAAVLAYFEGGIEYSLFRLGLGFDPVINNVQITMQTGWYPTSSTEQGPIGWWIRRHKRYRWPAITFERNAGRTNDCQIGFDAVPMDKLNVDNDYHQKIAFTKQYSWGVGEVVRDEVFGGKRPDKVMFVREYGLMITASKLEHLDAIIDIQPLTSESK